MKSKNIREEIESLIRNGYIKNERDLKNIPIDVLAKEYDLSINDLLCYFCESNNCDTKCKKEQ